MTIASARSRSHQSHAESEQPQAKRKYMKRRVSEMTPEQLKTTREKNKIMSRRNRLRQKIRYQATKGRLAQLDETNAGLKGEVVAQRTLLLQLRQRLLSSPVLVAKVLAGL